MNLTADLLQLTMPKAGRPWLEVMATELPKSGIDTPHEVASFVAQIAVESNELTHLEENLNYSAVRLAQVWSRFAVNPEAASVLRIPNDLAYSLQRNPEALANYIYDDANRGPRSRLGNTSPGDGWLHRGVGPLQITGRDNQTACADALGIPLDQFHAELLKPFNGIRSACWFWKTRSLDDLDDDDDVRAETRRVNGGETGLVHRQAYRDKCFKLMEGA